MNRSGSAGEAVGLAIGHVKTVLFQPFDVARWFMLGFIAFLAYLGEGGSSFNFRNPWRDDSLSGPIRDAVRWMMEHRMAVAVLLFFGILFLLLLSVLIQWLSSRGTFVYIDCIATNRAELVRPWKEHREVADSFFFWRLIFGLCAGFVILVLAIPLVVSFISMMTSGDELSFTRVLFGTGLVMVTLPLLALAIFISVFVGVTLKDFVAPVQYLSRIKCGEAFRVVLGLMRGSPGSFLLYFVLKILLAVAIAVGVFVIGCATCCIGFCCMALPVVGQTVLQPLYVFKRSFSLFFLQGFGPEFDVFGPGAPGGGLPGPLPPAMPSGPSWSTTPGPYAPPPPMPPQPPAPPESIPLSGWPETPPVPGSDTDPEKEGGSR